MADVTKGKVYKYKLSLKKTKGKNRGAVYNRYFKTIEAAEAAQKAASGVVSELKKQTKGFISSQEKRLKEAKAKQGQVSQLRKSIMAQQKIAHAKVQAEIKAAQARVNAIMNQGKKKRKKGKGRKKA